MPNWVYNKITITGAEADLKKFTEKAQQPYMTYHKGVFVEGADGKKTYDENAVQEQEHKSLFSFWNFKKPEHQEAYFASSDGEKKPADYETWSIEQRVAWDMQFKGNGWYSWNNREWGTKWDASDSEQAGSPKLGEVIYTFNTAWSPAVGAFEAIVEQHPELEFDFFCIEEQGWGVEFTSVKEEDEDGKEVQSLTETNSWDTPDTHAGWEAIGEECRSCSYGDDDEKYDDCPDSPKEVADAVAAFEDISELI